MSVTINGTTGITAPNSDRYINGFRLTLTSGTPVTTSDVVGATTIYCTPYKGNLISLYDGSNWNIRTSAEFSLALGTLVADTLYDIFCYDNAGVSTLEFAAWNDSSIATAKRHAAGTYSVNLPRQDGVYVKSTNGTAIDSTRRYLGTFCTTATTTTEDSATNRYLWNYYNRVYKRMFRQDSTASWTYTTATWRQARASSSNQVNFVCGVAEDTVTFDLRATASNSGGTGPWCSVGIGIDSTTTSTSPTGYFATSAEGSSPHAVYCNTFIGKHYAAWLEYSKATGTTTWYGTSSPFGSALSGTIQA